jgi:hypothetical protein
VIVARTQDKIQRAVYALNNIAVKYNFKSPVNKTKMMGIKGKMNVRTRI